MKRIIFLFAISMSLIVSAAEPLVILKPDKFGKVTAELVDCGGVRYKFYLPNSGSVKCMTVTGWYVIDYTGKILSYSDSKK
jgi:hypothetical protein